jgi:hypothetical protein
LLGALASHGNGYIRESAVIGLAASGSGDEVPFLLWRTTDWVEQVRERAIAAVRERLQAGNAAPFVKALPLLPRLEALGRVDLSGLVAEIRALVLGEPGLVSLMNALRAGNRPLRREACRTLDNVSPAPPAEVALLVSRNPDVVLRSWALRWEGRLRPADPLAAEEIRRSLLNDPVPVIRANALRAAVAADADGSLPALSKALLDTSASLRECARYHLRRLLGETDFAAYYRHAITIDRGDLIAAVAGLGETGTSADVPAVLPFLSGHSRLAQTALKAAARLGGDRARPDIFEALGDPRPGVRRTALTLVGARIAEAEADSIRNLWARSPDFPIQETLAAATLRLPPWLALEVFLRAVARDSTREAALAGLSRWRPEQNARYAPIPPPEATRMRLCDAVRTNSSRLPETLTLRLLRALD